MKTREFIRDMTGFEKVVAALTLLTALSLMLISLFSTELSSVDSILGFLWSGLAFPILVCFFIIGIIIAGRVVSRTMDYRSNPLAPKWLQFLAWALLIAWVVSKLRFAF